MTAFALPDEAILVLKQAGLTSPARLPSLIRRQVSFLELNLTGITVLTEAASGPYVVTPIIASLAGAARVIALTRDSFHATAAAVTAQTRALETLCGVTVPAEIYTERSLHLFAEADIVTNLGFVRPLDRTAIVALKPTAVVPLMCEPWEVRAADVDLEACRLGRIAAAGTNEDFDGLDVFAYSGPLCAKMLFDVQVEVHKSRILVVGSDRFGAVIARYLAASGARAELRTSLRDVDPDALAGLDAVVVADYTRSDTIIGREGDMSCDAFAAHAAGAAVVQFAGLIDVTDLARHGLTVSPGLELPAHRMARTLAYLGPGPVVDLHAAGLKVGELLLKRAGRLPGGPSDDRYQALYTLAQ
jgi:hypothetical protein